ncbi:Molybdopterin synthase catalytic subunit MoaE [hydrothermal vent metagenome]|uniref:Molybdopterin synthase catalytic subunit MoaE n=1 Tax=hydrothermal vent metagenome TaxID=652676 RepID=A0A3B0WY15_9ZZZZ
MASKIFSSPFDPWKETQTHQLTQLEQGKYGATASFVGTMRDFNQGDDVTSMTLEHYPGMTESYLNKICDEAKQRWQLLDCLIIHRVGEIHPNDPIVLTVAWSAHRKEAFEACRYLMEELKTRAPFWKKEGLTTGHRWVDKNTPG